MAKKFVYTLTHEPLHSRSYVKGHGNLFVGGPKFTQLFSLNVGKIVVDNTVIHLSIA